MHHILILGGGKIGSLIANLLISYPDFQVTLASQNFSYEMPSSITCIQVDVSQANELAKLLKTRQIHAVISCLPYFLNLDIAQVCAAYHCHYLDLTEDVEITKKIAILAKKSSSLFIPQCGLAPGFVNIVGEFLMSEFDECHELRLRVGGLPQFTQNSLKYALTWSLEGLINQYINPCPVIKNGVLIEEPALEQCETMTLDGVEYEAFNTSGGIGHLANQSLHHIKELNYKTLRYPGHCEKMKFLLDELKLKNDRQTLKRLLENSLPHVEQDQVIIYVSATGIKNGQWQEHHYYKKILPQMIENQQWSAMQIATASSVCVTLDLVLQNQTQYQGLVLHEKIHYGDFMANRFSWCFR